MFHRFQFQDRRTVSIFIVLYVLRSQPNLLIFFIIEAFRQYKNNESGHNTSFSNQLLLTK